MSADLLTLEAAHTYEGMCPDEETGWQSRDPKCPACRALIELSSLRDALAALTRERDSLRAELATMAQRAADNFAAAVDAQERAAPTPAAADAGALRDALRRLVDLYVANPGTPYEFIACYTPEKHQRSKSEAWKAWCAARAALAADAGRAKTEGGE